MNKTIIIDGFFLKTKRGIGLHLRNFICELQKRSGYTLILLVPESVQLNDIGSESLRIIKIKVTNIIIWYSIVMPLYSFKLKSNLSIFPANIFPIIPIYGEKLVTIHDVIFLSEEWINLRRRSIYQNLGRLLLRFFYSCKKLRNTEVITISNYSHNQIKLFLKNLSSTVIYQGPGQYFTNYKPVLNQDMRKSIVCFASIDQRKNSQLAIDVFLKSKLYAKGFRLILCGDVERIKKNNKGVLEKDIHNIILVDRPSEDEVSEVLSTAACFLFLSEEEGFGLPIIEVSRLGIPVICSNKGASAEVGDQIAYLVDIQSEDGIVNLLEKVCCECLTPKRTRSEIDVDFNWKNYVDQYLKVIESKLVRFD